MPRAIARSTPLRSIPTRPTHLAFAIVAALVLPAAHADDFTAGDFASLTQAINSANAADSRTTPHTITLTDDITLEGPLPPIFCNVTIDGANYTIDGGGQYRPFFIGVDFGERILLSTEFPDSALAERIAVNIQDLTLTNGLALGGGSTGAGGGGLGAGGALFINGAADVTLTNVSMYANAAQGGNGNGGTRGGGGGMGGNAQGNTGGAGGGLFGDSMGNGGGGLFGVGANSATNLGGSGGGGYYGDGGDGGTGAIAQNNPNSLFGFSGSGGNAGGGTASTGGADGGGGAGDNSESLAGAGGGGFGGLSGTAGDVGNDIGGNGGDGGFGGGGGGAGAYGSVPGNGGWGGGGGDGGGASGGFGGGGGMAGNGGFGGGGGAGGGNGGWGGGGASPNSSGGGVGGFGGGNGGGTGNINYASGGGAGMGGAIFVMDSATLTFHGNASFGSDTVTGGEPGHTVPGLGVTGGEAWGAGLFLQGSAGAVVFDLGDQQTFIPADDIADEYGSDPDASGNRRGIDLQGTGTLDMTGEYKYAGDTTVEGGTVLIEGKVDNSGVVVNGGAVAGPGTIAALTVNNGSVVPGGAGFPFNPLTVSGDASFSSAAILSLSADPEDSESPSVVIGGTATLGGVVQVDFLGGESPAVGTIYTVLSASVIQGQFNRVELPAGVYGVLVYNATGVQLQITDTAPDEIFSDGFEGAGN